MSTLRKEIIISKGLIASLLDGTLEPRDLERDLGADSEDVDLDMPREAFLQVQAGYDWILIASDTEQLADNAEEQEQQTTYIKHKQFTMAAAGTVKVKAEIKATSPAACNCEIRVNGIDVGETWSTTSTSYVPQEATVTVGAGDLVQIWMRTTSAGISAWIRNAKICADIVFGIPTIGEVSG